MNKIEYKIGDATAPVSDNNKIIVHICNDIGGWGKGFVLAISKKWKEPEHEYRKWHTSQANFHLGEIQLVQVEKDLWVANLIGQHKIRKDEQGNPLIRYEAVAQGLKTVAVEAEKLGAEIHMPRIGCGLAGGRWEEIEVIIEDQLLTKDIKVVVYDFEP